MSERPVLDVWIHGWRAARIQRTAAGELMLAYSSEALDRFVEGRVLLSASMPVSASPYRGRGRSVVTNWLEGFVPEAHIREALEVRHGIRTGDSVAFLARLGRDCAGAVQFVAPDDLPGPSEVDGGPLSADELGALLDALPSQPLGATELARVSLGGLQSKLLLSEIDGVWHVPSGGRPSTHLIKPQPAELFGLAASEAFALEVCRSAGLDAEQCPGYEPILERDASEARSVLHRWNRQSPAVEPPRLTKE